MRKQCGKVTGRFSVQVTVGAPFKYLDFSETITAKYKSVKLLISNFVEKWIRISATQCKEDTLYA